MSAPGLTVLYEHNTDGLFDDLREIQRRFHFLPADELQRIAEKYKEREPPLHLRDIYAIASFYPHFRLQKPARVDVKICGDMVCHLRGATQLREALDENFHGRSKNDLTIGTVSCLGRCDCAPALVINDSCYEGFSPGEAVEEVREVLKGAPAIGKHGSKYKPYFPQKPLSDPYNGRHSYSALKEYVRTRNWVRLIRELRVARLRGMGGAGFWTDVKWEHVRRLDVPEKYIVCNADESEPGTIKDRYVLTHLPHLVIEGMILAGLCVGAKQGYLYIRHEYYDQEKSLKQALQWCRDNRLLGDSILDSDLGFHIHLFVSPGGYICGEETALLEAIEGKRAEPRNKPPLQVDEGLWGKPTIVNNVETLALATVIAAKGAQWFKRHGGAAWKDEHKKRHVSRGLKFVGISGDVQNPGIYEVTMGVTYGELIQRAGGPLNGQEILAFAPSGASAGFLPARKPVLGFPNGLSIFLDWDKLKEILISPYPSIQLKSMIGSCALVVFAEGRCMLELALNAARFFSKESCGKCVPCRIGSQKMVEILERWIQGRQHEEDQKLVEDLSHVLKETSICGLGQSVPAPILSVLKYFPEEFEEHGHKRPCPSKCLLRRPRI